MDLEKNISAIDMGSLLIAEPFMLDPNFKRSVILVTDYTQEEGTVGFILNKPIDMTINELIQDFPEFETQVYFGGPVATNTIHYIHDKGDILDDSTEISNGVFWGGDFETLKFLIESQLILPKNIKFFVGYSGWSPGQLEDEMRIGSWVPHDVDRNFVFNTKPTELWSEVLDKKGSTFTVISRMEDHMFLN